MCGHNWRRVCDVWVCVKCGMTRLDGGKIIFDRKLANYKSKKRKVKNENS